MSSQTFLGNDPGASKHGNFINYYDFHPAKERLDGFPTDVWWVDDRRRRFMCLDVGCNSGELTQALWEFVSSHLKFKPSDRECENIVQHFEQSSDCGAMCKILGVDLDPILILRAIEKNSRKDLVHFQCCDIMNDTEFKQVIESFFDVRTQGIGSELKFDAVFLFSVTMWIHLNSGDDGLRKLLLIAAKLARNLIVIEPQLWKSYAAAKRRYTRAGGDGFPLLPKLTLRSDEAIENEINNVLCGAGFKKISEYNAPKWKRKILFYKSCTMAV